MFSVESTPQKFENATIIGRVGILLAETSVHGNHMIIFKKLRFQNVFRPHENEKSAFLNSSGFKRVFEKLRFREY